MVTPFSDFKTRRKGVPYIYIYTERERDRQTDKQCKDREAAILFASWPAHCSADRGSSVRTF